MLATLAALTALTFHAGRNLATAREARLSLRLKKLENYFSVQSSKRRKRDLRNQKTKITIERLDRGAVAVWRTLVAPIGIGPCG
ncbi:hypothetical protein DESC_810067 [Desulfosarcina cetonica]|nr:hypothetical protein DESC_810067 [Desulfosarcina cetonica]